MLITGLVALGSLVAYVLVGLPFIVFPRTGPLPSHADVVFVLGPLTQKRVDVAKRLLAEGRVDTMLWSAAIASHEDYPLLQQCASTPHLICVRPSPATTQGEGLVLRQQAAEHGWTNAIVITQAAHITRARAIVGRCFSGRITMLDSGDPPINGWAYQYLYQTGATVNSWFDSAC